MTLLRERVKKADKLVFVSIPGANTATGGTHSPNSELHYQVSLFQKKEYEAVEISHHKIGEIKTNAVVISTCCQYIDVGSGKLNPMCDCKGNSRHTVCYHSLGWLKFKLAQRDKAISYFETAESAVSGLNFGGQLTKVISKQGNGVVWAVVKDKPQILSAEENVNLMRGSEDDEGID